MAGWSSQFSQSCFDKVGLAFGAGNGYLNGLVAERKWLGIGLILKTALAVEDTHSGVGARCHFVLLVVAREGNGESAGPHAVRYISSAASVFCWCVRPEAQNSCFTTTVDEAWPLGIVFDFSMNVVITIEIH